MDRLRIALLFLTRLPVGRDVGHAPDLAAAVPLFPVVGALVGLVAGAAFTLAWWAGLPLLAAGALALMAEVWVTGALHEDGLADSADGLGGRDAERALAIMADSRLGSFGVLALVTTLLARAATLASLAQPAAVVPALVAAGAVSRALVAAVMAAWPAARAGGLAAAAGRPGALPVALGLGLAGAVALAVLPLPRALGALAVAGAVAFVTARQLARRLGGCTGDTLGAVQQLSGLAFLLAAAARP